MNAIQARQLKGFAQDALIALGCSGTYASDSTILSILINNTFANLAALRTVPGLMYKPHGTQIFISGKRNLERLVHYVQAAAPAIEDVLAALAKEVPEEEWDSLPRDLTDRLDDYLYGDRESHKNETIP